MDMRTLVIVAVGSLGLFLYAPMSRADSPAAPLVAAWTGPVPEALEATLEHLSAPTPVSGTLAITRKDVQGKGRETRHSQAHVVLEVSSTHGITLHLPGATLQQVTAEMKAFKADADRPAPDIALLGETGFLQVSHVLATGTRLRILLGGAKLLQQKQVTLDGNAATLLQFNLPAQFGKDSDKVKQFDDTLTLWLSPQDVPLQYLRKTKTEIGWLFFHMTSSREELGTLEVLDGRLLTRQADIQETVDALGKHEMIDTKYVLDAHVSTASARPGRASPSSSL